MEQYETSLPQPQPRTRRERLWRAAAARAYRCPRSSPRSWWWPQPTLLASSSTGCATSSCCWYPLANGITHLAHGLPTYVSDAEHGRGWIGHLLSRYHVQNWVTASAPKLVSLGRGLAKPALSLGKGAFSLVLSLITIFALILLLLLEGPRMRSGLLSLMQPARAERYSRIAREVNRSVTGYMLGNFLTSIIAGIVGLVTLLVMASRSPACGRCGWRWWTSCR